jgi:hypothetical protein
MPARSRIRARFSDRVLEAIDRDKIFRVRAGARSDHRFTGIWVVVVRGRVFARSWTLEPGGWYRTFLEDPLGTIQVGGREIPVRAARVRLARTLDAIESAYARKYDTPASAKYVRGFRSRRRRQATIEFRPRR